MSWYGARFNTQFRQIRHGSAAFSGDGPAATAKGIVRASDSARKNRMDLSDALPLWTPMDGAVRDHATPKQTMPPTRPAYPPRAQHPRTPKPNSCFQVPRFPLTRPLAGDLRHPGSHPLTKRGATACRRLGKIARRPPHLPNRFIAHINNWDSVVKCPLQPAHKA